MEEEIPSLPRALFDFFVALIGFPFRLLKAFFVSLKAVWYERERQRRAS